MSIARKILSAYRKMQYKVCGRNEYGVMPAGIECSHTPFEEEINHGDVVHPCVRYIEEGYLGHKWWMVYTPYYAANDKTENPILCYGENESDEPPTHWIVKYQVQAQPSKGYNSDPTLFFDDDKLYVMWRENLTERCCEADLLRGTFGAVVGAEGIGEVFGPLVGTDDFEIDPEVSPTFLKSRDGTYRCLAMHLKFHSRTISSMRSALKKIVSTLANVLDLVGIWSQQKSFGIAQWDSDSINATYKLNKTVRFDNCNNLYRPWHMDFFEYKEKLYAIVQTNQSNADICLAESENGINFRMFDLPLMTNKTSGKIGIYKPTGGVVGDCFYLYYTAQHQNDRRQNRLYLSTCDISEVLK